jgi:hypothetical protein
MCTPVKFDIDAIVFNLDIGRHINQVSKYLARLSVRIPSHSFGQEPIESPGDNQERHVKVHLKSD